MRHDKLLEILENAEKDNRFVEAFLVLSIYVESVVTTLSIAVAAKELGYSDGKSFGDAYKSDLKIKEFYDSEYKADLKDKINNLKKVKMINNQDSTGLHHWRTNQRNKIFHQFAEKMLSDKLEIESKEYYLSLKELTKKEWFYRMQLAFIKTEVKLGLHEIRNYK